VQNHELLKIYTSSTVKTIGGYVGNYETVIETPKGEREFIHGVAIVAVGTEEHIPKSYHYGKNPRVITQRELEEKLRFTKPEEIRNGETYVMIQCVEFRDEDRPYYSRI